MSIQKKNPFILNIYPSLNNGFELSPQNVILKFIIDSPKIFSKPIIVCDLEFGSIDLCKKIVDLEFDFVFSFQKGREKDIWSVLSYKMEENKSRAAFNNKNNLIYSSQMVKNSKNEIFYKNIVSSSFFSFKLFENKSDSNYNNIN